MRVGEGKIKKMTFFKLINIHYISYILLRIIFIFSIFNLVSYMLICYTEKKTKYVFGISNINISNINI